MSTHHMRYGKLWFCLILVIVGSFVVLGYFGREVYRQAPPIPKRVITPDGRQLFTGDEILEGQGVWESIGGQEVGSIWGHGSYVAPDWSADWLHREAAWILEHWAEIDHNTAFEKLGPETQAALRSRLQTLLRANTYDPQTRDLVIPQIEADAIRAVGEHYAALFGDNPALAGLRSSYALPPNTINNIDRQYRLNDFFFWTAWACVTNRPGQQVSYTQNWPPEELVGNHPRGSLLILSVASFVLFLIGVGVLGMYYAMLRRRSHPNGEPDLPERDPLLALRPTASMRATAKFFWTVALLFVVQVALGALTAHFGIRGTGFYGYPVARWLPYSVSRTWHLQLAIFWIAMAWMGAALFIAPAVAGREPRYQSLGVNVLYFCMLLIIGGSMAGQWWGVRQHFSLVTNFWMGHQGLEYVDLGRLWQILLLGSLLLWVWLLLRGLWPAFHRSNESRHLLALFLISALAIALFYGVGLIWRYQTNLARIEYWRWWVVHLWVEGFFEVFATVIIAFLFTRMGLLAVRTATSAVFFSTAIFLLGGIVGTFHHLYFTGTPEVVTALGSVFSALEVVPLVLIGLEAYENLDLSQARPWVHAYRWPVNFFIAVAFWNLVGAGLFGFLINTPIALYYMQGLNTTPAHVHAALFGVYGMLAIGLLLFCLKGLTARRVWRTGALAFAFWAINLGVALTVLLSLLPVGLYQTWAAVENSMWYARSAEFLQSDMMNKLRLMRVIGDVTFAAGVLALVWFIAGLKTGWSLSENRELILQREHELANNHHLDHEKWD